MKRFHVNEKGLTRQCNAKTVETCTVKSSEGFKEHFSTKEAAENAFEQYMEKRNDSSLSLRKPNKTFTYITQKEAKNFYRKINELRKLYKDYEYDYSSYDADERPGEKEFIKKYDPSKYTNEKISYTADNIILKINETGDLSVLMIQRGGHPFKGFWAHPGGFIDDIKDSEGNVVRKESRYEAAARELEEETGMILQPEQMQAVSTYDHPDRDPRMEVHMNTHVVLLTEDKKFAAADDAVDAKYIPIKDIYNGKNFIAFDHKQSIKDALEFVYKNIQ